MIVYLYSLTYAKCRVKCKKTALHEFYKITVKTKKMLAGCI